ncbi:antitoxin VbhA family protein [Mycolicibacter icosiumassiliensis]|uniref:antitoxin VbhA family protein n=1 Tax=Mycolicibacter icosiumassiliensis TaxID=1792835 RepID=UPI000833536A|nr:antitoxin VbhA family protein [Mycolicibacter icosiumassiliensis]
MTETETTERRAKTVRSIRRSSELEGAQSTAATRADQDDYVRGAITAAELGDRVRRRYNIQ